ncbi:DUF3990 domain-containing protein [Priestia megaterium]|uniref:DUF3990 domain-containing protein n=1 Tax=Priestia megaterium TaxID=1404 RepID=UPI0021D67F29|nr:DUF3990 domain-containing protein [Priestia megaterium]MCU7767012.1 DUF3990 domain-containing protein [Priestia megaterium]
MPKLKPSILAREFKSLDKTMYHGTNSRHYQSLFNGVSLRECKNKTDFGRGFYLTTKFIQASKHANNRSRFNGDAIVFVYDVDVAALRQFQEKIFRKMDREWAEFIYLNRSERVIMDHHGFDYVFGGVADGKIEDLIEELDEINVTPNSPEFDYFYESIAKYDTYDQLSIHNQEIFDYNIITLRKVVRAFNKNSVYEYDASQITL